MKYVCPSCGALNEETGLVCEACGFVLAADVLRRKQQIEQRLSGELPAGTNSATVSQSFVSRMDSPVKAAEPGEPGQSEKMLSGEVDETKHGRRRRLIIAATLLLLALLLAAFSAGAIWGGRWRSAGPERVVTRLERAVNTQDWELFQSLFSSTSAADGRVEPSWVTEGSYRLELKVTDVILGERSEMAFVILRYRLADSKEEDWNSDAEQEASWPQDQMMLMKKDGQWKIEYSYLYSQLMQGSITDVF